MRSAQGCWQVLRLGGALTLCTVPAHSYAVHTVVLVQAAAAAPSCCQGESSAPERLPANKQSITCHMRPAPIASARTCLHSPITPKVAVPGGTNELSEWHCTARTLTFTLPFCGQSGKLACRAGAAGIAEGLYRHQRSDQKYNSRVFQQFLRSVAASRQLQSQAREHADFTSGAGSDGRMTSFNEHALTHQLQLQPSMLEKPPAEAAAGQLG
jgi:hypothetical protein